MELQYTHVNTERTHKQLSSKDLVHRAAARWLCACVHGVMPSNGWEMGEGVLSVSLYMTICIGHTLLTNKNKSTVKCPVEWKLLSTSTAWFKFRLHGLNPQKWHLVGFYICHPSPRKCCIDKTAGAWHWYCIRKKQYIGRFPDRWLGAFKKKLMYW